MNKIDFIMFVLDNSTWNTFRILANMLDSTEVSQLAQRVINTKKAEIIYRFAFDINYAPILELAQAILEIKNPEYIYAFAHYIKNAPIKKLSSFEEYQDAIEKHIDLLEISVENEVQALAKVQQWINEGRMDSVELFINSLSSSIPSLSGQEEVKSKKKSL